MYVIPWVEVRNRQSTGLFECLVLALSKQTGIFRFLCNQFNIPTV